MTPLGPIFDYTAVSLKNVCCFPSKRSWKKAHFVAVSLLGIGCLSHFQDRFICLFAFKC